MSTGVGKLEQEPSLKGGGGGRLYNKKADI